MFQDRIEFAIAYLHVENLDVFRVSHSIGHGVATSTVLGPLGPFAARVDRLFVGGVGVQLKLRFAIGFLAEERLAIQNITDAALDAIDRDLESFVVDHVGVIDSDDAGRCQRGVDNVAVLVILGTQQYENSAAAAARQHQNLRARRPQVAAS